MTHPLFPDLEPTFGPLHVGEINRRDADVLDDDFRRTSQGPKVPAGPIMATPMSHPRKTGRLLTGTWTLPATPFTSAPAPVLILPADANRDNFVLRVSTTDATPMSSLVSIADDPSKLQVDPAYGLLANSGAARVYVTATAAVSLSFMNYTGPIFATALGSNFACFITVWSVTE